MPRKTKETNQEKIVKKLPKLNEKIDALIKNVLESDESITATKKTAKKSASTTKVKAKSATKSTKSTKSTNSTKKEKEETKATKKSTTKKTAVKKSTKTLTKSKSASAKVVSKPKSKKAVSPTTLVEYYDLPYKYNQTVVKILYQNPTTLFVYWEISDTDIEYYKEQYGENFFEVTKPVLVIHNDTMNYSFEIDINDFANSWYFNINDSKCNYRVELIRKPVVYNEKIKTDYVYITSSNKIETPNDRILFSTNEPYIVYFKNTKNNSQRKVNIPKLLEHLNLSNKEFEFPIVNNVYDLYKNIYHIEDIEEFSVSLTNPSSGNPSSHSLSSRFI